MSNHILNLRAYFAARAPAEIPEWYQPLAVGPRPQFPSTKGWTPHVREEFDSLRDGSLSENNASLTTLAHYRDWKDIENKMRYWVKVNDQQRYFGWRWFYADQMLASQSPADETASERPA